MAHPQPDCSYAEEAEIACGGFVVSGGDAAGVLELVEAPLDHVSQPIKRMIHTDAHLAHWDLGQDAAVIHGFANVISVIALIRQ